MCDSPFDKSSGWNLTNLKASFLEQCESFKLNTESLCLQIRTKLPCCSKPMKSRYDIYPGNQKNYLAALSADSCTFQHYYIIVFAKIDNKLNNLIDSPIKSG